MSDQVNQNPDTRQEEKPEAAVPAAQTVTKESPKGEQTEQIGSDEKKEIVELLKGSAVKPAVGKKKAAAPRKSKAAKKKPQSQLSADERDEVAALLRGETPKESQPMADEEKEAIVSMLRDEHLAESEARRAEEEQEATAQISKSERDEIVALLGGKSAGEAPEKEVEQLDYEKLNKQQLVEVLEQIVEEKDISKIRNDIARIKVAFHNRNKEDIARERQRFIEAGGKEEDFKPVVGPLEQRYNAAFARYKHNKARYAEELEKQKQENLKLKQQILEELKTLIDSEESLKKTYDEFKKLQTRWREIGMVPAAELSNLWQNYHFLVERFFDKVKISKELRDLDMRKNMEKKIKLCEKAEELLLEKSIVKSFKLLQKYHEEWREIGPVPSEHKEALWERFRASTQKINQRRKEHYKELQEEQQKNYQAKVAMCEKAEELIAELPTTLKGWNQQTEKVNELLKLWKTIGRAPRHLNDEIWARFKGSLDSFFNAKREFLAKVKEQQTNNYNLKLDLCVQAEALKDSDDWAAATTALINLQKEWKKIGPVPRRRADKIWKRFRAACDHFFDRKKEHFKQLHGAEGDNLKAKQELIEEIKKFEVSDDKKVNLDALKSFQSRWMEIGHVPFKKKDEIQTAYREAVDGLIDRMDINKEELSASGFQSKVEMLKTAPDAERRLSKERHFITGKIKSLQEDLIVLENNIGFFSDSEQAKLLKQEFEKKIEKAKKEISALKEKLRLLDS